MSEEHGGGLVSDVAKVFNDARYVPTAFGIVAAVLICLVSKDALGKDEPRHSLLIGVGLYTWWATMVGYVHTYLAWRKVKAARLSELRNLINEQKANAGFQKYAIAVGENATLGSCAFAVIVGLHLAGAVLAYFEAHCHWLFK